MQPTDDSDVLSQDVAIGVQIYRQLRAEILDGLWAGRDDFMGERELAARFGVSVITSRASLERLAAEGLLSRGRGRKNRVLYEPNVEAVTPAPGIVGPSAGTHVMSITLLEAGVSVAPAEACRAFSLPAGSELWQCLRLRTFQGRPDSVTHNAQLAETGLRHSRRNLQRLPMLAIFEAERVEIATIHRRLAATKPPPLAARHLGLSIDDPVLLQIQVVRDNQEQIVEWVRTYSHADRYEPEEVLDLKTGAARGWLPIR